MVMKVDSGIEIDRISESQSFDLLWKLLRFWHARVTDQHRNDRKLALQGVSDLKTNEIARIINSTNFSLTTKPICSDYSDDKLGAVNHVFDMIAKIDAVRNGVEVHEYVPSPKLRLETIIKPSSDRQ